MTAVPQPRIEQGLCAQLAARDATLDRQARTIADLRERMRLIRGLAGDGDVLDDCGPTARRAMERIAALAAGR